MIGNPEFAVQSQTVGPSRDKSSQQEDVDGSHRDLSNAGISPSAMWGHARRIRHRIIVNSIPAANIVPKMSLLKRASQFGR